MTDTAIEHKRVFHLDESVSVAELEALAAASGWPLSARFTSGFEESVELQWKVASGAELGYVENHADGVRLVTVRGADRALVDATAATLGEVVATTGAEQLLATLADATVTDPVVIVRAWRAYAALSAHAETDAPLDERLVTTVEQRLRHPQRQVRLRTLLVCDALGARWPELVDAAVARDGEETELAYVVDAFVQLRRESSQDA